MSGEVRELLTNFYKNFTYQLYYEVGTNFDWESAPCIGCSCTGSCGMQ